MTATREPPVESGGPVAHVAARHTAWADWTDRVVGSDPGLNRLRSALQSVLTIGVTLGAEYLFVKATGALQLSTAVPAAAAAAVATANHEFLVIAMLLGAIVGMISSFAVMDTTASGQLASMLFVPFPMIAALALGIGIGGHRVLSLTSLVVVLAVGTYLRRFGPRGFLAGMLLFMGDFFGFFLHGAVTMSDLGWLSAEIGVGVVVGIAVRFTLFFPRPARNLERSQRSYVARARRTASTALACFDDTSEDRSANLRRLHRQLVRLNEAALMIDAQLGDPAAVPGGSGGPLHERLFDIELALTNVARFAPVLSRIGLPADQLAEARGTLVGLVDRDEPAARAHAGRFLELLARDEAHRPPDDRLAVVIGHRFAHSVIALLDAFHEWLEAGRSGPAGRDYQPTVTLFGGFLPGSTQVSAIASGERGTRPGDRVRLPPYLRTAIQMAVAVGAAIAIGDQLSGRRFYWAVIAAFITFMGANNSGEQTRKAILRVAGTVVGIAIGSLAAHAVGHHTNWSLAVVLVSLFFAFYLIRVNYAFMVVGITVMVSQLYVQLDEFSNSLLLLRLEETAIGAAVAIAVVALVLPLRTQRVLRIALRSEVQAVSRLVTHAVEHLTGAEGPASERSAGLRSDAREVDAAYQALVTTAQPLRRNLFGSFDDRTGRVMHLAFALRNYSRNLVVDTDPTAPLDEDARDDICEGAAILTASLDVVAEAFTGPRDGTYVRSASRFDQAERRIEARSPASLRAQLALRDLELLDGAAAQLAEAVELRTSDFDAAVAEAGAD